ncbi:MAG: hypothetical protein JSW48_11100 [Betaproteobacteria bacterium]|jgi:hypothetical protein|nr:MAG: hypothetical protein JSW48_11100 [Betaproteobacteria bacterium]
MPRKLSPEEAAVMIIRRRLQQMEEDKMARRERTADSLEQDEPEPAQQRRDRKTAEG